MFDKHFIGLDLTSVEDKGLQRPISRVTFLLDDENSVTAGDDTGMELLADCPHATQAIADAVLAQVKGYRYQMFSAAAAALDPAAELGDAVTAGSLYSVFSQLSDDGSGYVDLSAPGKEDLEDEFPAEGPMTKAFNRKITQVRSSIKKTAEEITLLVEDTASEISSEFSVKLESITSTVSGLGGKISSIEQYADRIVQLVENTESGLNSKIEQSVSSLTSEINSTKNGLNSKIEQTVSSLTSQINGLDGQVSGIEQYVDNITLSVSNGSTSSTITLKSGSTTIASKEIKMDGLVTFTGLSSGTTSINGACIKTGTIDADRLNLTGKITFSDLNTSTQSKINTASSNASSALTTANAASTAAASAKNTVAGWTYTGTTMIDGSKIVAGTVIAGSLKGGEVQLLSASGEVAGTIQIDKSYITQNGRVAIAAEELNLASTAYHSSMYFTAGGDTSFTMLPENEIMVGATMYPGGGVWDLGTSRLRWNDLYVANDPIVISDRKKKTGITYGLDVYDAFFDALQPVSYKLISGQSGRTHLGLIAQDVEQAMKDCGLTGIDFAGFVKSPRMDDKNQIIEGEYDYALRYGEFVSMCIYQLQKLKARVAELERRIAR